MSPTTTTPTQELSKLIDGNNRFIQGLRSVDSLVSVHKMHDLAENGQKPKAIILTCSDSRAPAEILFDVGVGELFVVRVAGNVVAPSLIASIEFAIANFGSELLMVLGHTKCGAVNASIHYCQNTHEAPPSKNLSDLIERIKPAVKRTEFITKEQMLMDATLHNIENTMHDILQESVIIKEAIRSQKVKMVGAILDIHTGKVSLLDEASKLSNQILES